LEGKKSSKIVKKNKVYPAKSTTCCRNEISSCESNEIIDGRDESIPISPLIIFKGTFNGIPVKILKDDGCNTNVVSKAFVKNHKALFQVVNKKMSVNHSCEGQTEEVAQVVLNGKLTLGNHCYMSTFVVANCRYDIFLGMP
jgi:Aspartyl protease